MEIEARVKSFIKTIRTGLKNASCKEDILKWACVIKKMLCTDISSAETYGQTIDSFQFDEAELLNFKKIITSSHSLAQQLYDALIEQFSVEWMKMLTPDYYQNVVKVTFLYGCSDDAFLSILQAIDSTEKDFRFQMCVSLLEDLLTEERLTEMLERQCQVPKEMVLVFLDDHIDLLVTSLTSFPERMANRLQQDNSDKFFPREFFPLLAVCVLKTLTYSHRKLTACQDVSLKMISELVGKLCLTGASDLFLDTLLPHLCSKVRTDYVWSRLCVRVFTGVPSRCTEAVMVPLLRKLPWYGLIDKFVGNYVCEDSRTRMLICTKLVLHKYFPTPRLLLHNIIGYLSSSPERRHLYLETFTQLLSVWGSPTSMRHISSEQHHYISLAIMVCLGALNKKDIASRKGDFLQLLMPGVQAHLESSDPRIRLEGMTVAKRLTHTLDPDGPQLEFELDLSSDVVKGLLSHESLPEDPGDLIPSQQSSTNKELDENIKLDNTVTSAAPKITNIVSPAEDEGSDLDSDDDLVPYDMSNDTVVKTVKPPKYLRDCMEGLICTADDIDKAELCLKHAEDIIRTRGQGLEQIGAEFAKILLHMSNSHSLEDFYTNRRKALVALAAMCPQTVADYLTSQFYERNYNLRQRMDILEVLADAAMELSQPEKSRLVEKKKIVELSPASDGDQQSWRDIVQRRIESNTRRFAKGASRPTPVAQLNRFAPVAGAFFYPLLVRADVKQPCLDLLGQDSSLLFRLVYTLTIVMHAAANIPGVVQMGRTLLEFTWSLRTHPDQCVRQSVLMATTTVFLSVPTHSIVAELHTDVAETLAWLESVLEKDADAECQKQAAQAMMVLQEQMKKGADHHSG